MSKKLIESMRRIRSGMDAACLPLDKRDEVQTRFLAALIAGELNVPSSKLEGSPKIHFTNVHLSHVNQLIGEVNEEVVVNIDAVQQAVYHFWHYRYELLHNPIRSGYAAIQDLFPGDDHTAGFLVSCGSV